MITALSPSSLSTTSGSGSRSTRSADYWACVWDLNKAIKTDLQAAGYSIPFPQRDVHIVSGDKSGGTTNTG